MGQEKDKDIIAETGQKTPILKGEESNIDIIKVPKCKILTLDEVAKVLDENNLPRIEHTHDKTRWQRAKKLSKKRDQQRKLKIN